MSRQRAKGTSWETELLPRLRLLFGSQVDRAPLKGVNDKGDFIGLPPGFLVEAKNTNVPKWLEWAATAEAKGRHRWCVVWKGDRRKARSGPYVLMPLEEWERLIDESQVGRAALGLMSRVDL